MATPLYKTGTTIRISKELFKEIEENRLYPEETKDSILKRLLGV